MYHMAIDISTLAVDAVRCFEQNPALPGIVLLRDREFAGMISRRRFLEHMSRPYSIDLFLKRPILALYKFTQTHVDVFPQDALIVKAAGKSLKRSPELLYEPIVVECQAESGETQFALIDIHQLLLAQSRIHKLTSKLLDESNYAQRVQTEKMVSLGRMVSGVAHEIKNPVNSVNGNVEFLTNYFDSLIELIKVYQAELGAKSERIAEIEEDLDLEFILEDTPQILKSVRLSSERLIEIVTSLRNFARVDDRSKQFINIHECIDGTLLILDNQIRHDVEVVRDYEELPDIACYSGQLSQVFMNLLSNAVDVLFEKREKLSNDPNANWHPKITVQTRRIEREEGQPWVSIKIIDNGLGIPPENQQKIFDNYFTTKPVGKGTGLGLAISYQIVVEKHQGELRLKSQVGEWTEFEVLIPFITMENAQPSS